MEEIDIWRSATLLLKQCGGDADAHSARHVAAVIQRGDAEGEAVWERIMRAIRELQRLGAQPGYTTH
jgi:hypothetical protein